MSNAHRPHRGAGSDTGDVHYVATGFIAHIHNSSACPQVHLQQASARLSVRSVYSRWPWKSSLTIARISALPVMFPINFDEDTRKGDSIHEALSILLLELRALASAVIWRSTVKEASNKKIFLLSSLLLKHPLIRHGIIKKNLNNVNGSERIFYETCIRAPHYNDQL